MEFNVGCGGSGSGPGSAVVATGRRRAACPRPVIDGHRAGDRQLESTQQYRFGLVAKGCKKLHSMSIKLKELLKSNMPYKTREASGKSFEKEHSILHKGQVAHTFNPETALMKNAKEEYGGRN